MENSIDNWIERVFADNPNLRAILQLDPTGVGSAYDVMLSYKISELRKNRFRTLMEELAKGDKELTPDLINSDDFLHAFYCVTKASLDSRRIEKIKLFARLLINAAKNQSLQTDMLEEFISILEDLSYREFQILHILFRYESQSKREEKQNDLQFVAAFWDNFENSIYEELCIGKKELPSMLVRLNRTGLYETFTGSFWGYSGEQGKTTYLYRKFIEWVELSSNE